MAPRQRAVLASPSGNVAATLLQLNRENNTQTSTSRGATRRSAATSRALFTAQAGSSRGVGEYDASRTRAHSTRRARGGVQTRGDLAKEALEPPADDAHDPPADGALEPPADGAHDPPADGAHDPEDASTQRRRGRPAQVSPISTPEKKKVKKELQQRRREEAAEILKMESPLKPMRVSEAEHVTFVAGSTTYPHRSAVLANIKACAERDKKALSFSDGPNGKGQKSADFVRALCPVKGCAFKTSFRLCHGKWLCKAHEAHTCVVLPEFKKKGNFHAYTAPELAPVLTEALAKNANMKPNDAVAHVQPYVGKDVTNAFAGKVLKEAKALASASLSASKFKPLAELVNASGIGHLTVHTTNAEGMKKIYKARMKAEHELKEKDLPDKAKTPFVEPNTEHITDEGGEYLTGYTYVPGAIKALWNAGLVEKTPSFADGAHSEGAFGGTFLSTTTLDANRHLLPMCVTWTIMNEDKESWTSHYRAVKEHYPALDVSTHANITDGDKGLKPSRAEVFPNMLGFSCERHRSENVRVQPGVGSAGRDAYREAVYGYSAAKLAHAKSIMNAQTKAYLEKLPDKCQYLRAAFEAGAHLRGYAVSSPAESWNNWMTNQSVRHNANVVQSFLNLMDGIENQTEKRIAAAAKRTDAAPPKIRLLLNSGGEAKKKVRDRVVVFQNNLRRVAKVWHKSYPGICQTVNLNDGTCTCCRPEIVGGPFCVSLASAAKSAGVDLAKFLPPQETTKRWREQWEYVHQWRAGKTIPCIADLALLPEHPLKDPVAGPRPKGRPAEPKRHLSAVEDAAKQHKCKVCGMKGHNARSKQCPKFSLTAHDTTLALPGGDEDDENEEEEFMMPQEESGEE